MSCFLRPLCIAFLFGSFLFSQEPPLTYQEEIDVRIEAIEQQLKKHAQGKEKRELFAEKAALLAKKQCMKEAFLCFLEALPEGELVQEDSLDGALNYALPLYLKANRESAAQEELEKYIASSSFLSSTHPLHIIQACLEANKGHFQSFFTLAFPPIEHHPASYLAWKVRGMVCLQIFEMSSSLDERERFKKQAIDCFMKAFELMPEDQFLAIRILYFGRDKDAERYAQVIEKALLSRPLRSKWIQRSDMLDIIAEFLEIKQYDFFDRLALLYESFFGMSRSLNELKEERRVAGKEKSSV